MPIYEYRCERGHMFEVLQRMSDDPPSTCTSCDATVKRVLNPVAVHFKGSGFYTTDYARKGRGTGDSGDGAGGGSGGGDSASKDRSAQKAGSDDKAGKGGKEPTKAGSSSGSGSGSTGGSAD
jgi:putative FmdB family regulatory protein